jgi:hypothetical protein
MPTISNILLSLFFLTSSSAVAAHVLPPQPPYPIVHRATNTPSAFEGKCSFTVWHKKVSEVNYIQINKLIDHSNDLEVDLSQIRPRTERNSYAKVSSRRVFAIEGLLDGGNLTIRGKDGDDTISFESNGLSWTSKTEKEVAKDEKREAWCELGYWVEGGKSTRVSCR